MELKTYFAQDRAGNIIPNASVTIYLAGTTTLATGLKTLSGGDLSNPFTASSDGRIQFRAADGLYDMLVSMGSESGQRITIQCIDIEQQLIDADSAADRSEAAATRAENAADSVEKNTFEVDSEAEMLALSASKGDLAIRTDVQKTFSLSAVPATTLENWLELPNDAMTRLAQNDAASQIGTTSGAKVQDYINVMDINTVTALMASSLPTPVKAVRTSGYNNIFGVSDLWNRTTETTTPGQTPIQLGRLSVSDANGVIWDLDISSGKVFIDSIGAPSDGVADAWPFIELAFKSTEGKGTTVTTSAQKYFHSKPILIKSKRRFLPNPKLNTDFVYGGGVLTEAEAPQAATPVGIGQTSVFSGKKAHVIAAHDAGKFANFFAFGNMYVSNASGVTADYGVYCPFANMFEMKNFWSVGANIGFDARNIYIYSMDDCFFNAGSVMGTVGMNITPITNGYGSGTSGVLNRVGILNYRYSHWMAEMNYTVMNSCYSEGTLTRNALHFERCNGIVVNSYGIENLTAVGTEGRLLAVIDSQMIINGLQASFNVNLSGCTAITVTSTAVGTSQVKINDVFIVGVGSAYGRYQTDNNSMVEIDGFKFSGVTPSAEVVGKRTIQKNIQDRWYSEKLSGQFDAGGFQIGEWRLWDDGTNLRAKRGSDPTSNTDGQRITLA